MVTYDICVKTLRIVIVTYNYHELALKCLGIFFRAPDSIVMSYNADQIGK